MFILRQTQAFSAFLLSAPTLSLSYILSLFFPPPYILDICWMQTTLSISRFFIVRLTTHQKYPEKIFSALNVRQLFLVIVPKLSHLNPCGLYTVYGIVSSLEMLNVCADSRGGWNMLSLLRKELSTCGFCK